jgi:hypothetical protein
MSRGIWGSEPCLHLCKLETAHHIDDTIYIFTSGSLKKFFFYFFIVVYVKIWTHQGSDPHIPRENEGTRVYGICSLWVQAYINEGTRHYGMICSLWVQIYHLIDSNRENVKKNMFLRIVYHNDDS